MIDRDIENLKRTIALERFAISRYDEQIQKIPIPKLKMLLPGIRTNEEGHEAQVLKLARARDQATQMEDIPLFTLDKPLEEILAGEGYKSKPGFKTILQAFYLDLYFEKNAVKLYQKFAEDSEDEEIRKFFLDTTRSEQGHVRIFKEVIDQIHRNQLDIEFYCPVCGWIESFGREPNVGNVVNCRKCGIKIILKERDGDFYVERME